MTNTRVMLLDIIRNLLKDEIQLTVFHIFSSRLVKLSDPEVLFANVKRKKKIKQKSLFCLK